MKEKNNQKGFIQVPLLITIIAAVLAIGGGSYFGVKQYKNYQAGQNEKDKQAQELSAKQQQTVDDTQSGKLNTDAFGDFISPKIGKTTPTQEPTITTPSLKPASSIRYIKDTTDLYTITGERAYADTGKDISRGTQIKFISEGDPFSKIEVNNQEFWVFDHDLVLTAPPAQNLSAIIKQWRPIVAYVECDFRDLNTHELYSQVRGSGVVFDFDSQITVVTNRHIIADKNNYQPFICRVKLPDSSDTFTGQKFTGGGPLDVGFIDINNPNVYIKYITSASSPSYLPQCTTKPSLGESVLILGYPSIGSQTDITVTEGMISGYDGDYYITSAKIDKGNSGGAAILVNDNCYLGIPSASVVGQIESLGRILDVRVMRGER